MDEKQIEELNKAIAQLSKEDQAEITGGNTITDDQCRKIKSKLVNPTLVAYGGPGWWSKPVRRPVTDLPIDTIESVTEK